MYKNFDVVYNGVESFEGKEMDWTMDNLYNKRGADRRNFIPVSAGAGVNMWLNDKLRIGIQGEYIAMPYKNAANNLEGTVRLIWRFGEKSKKTAPIVIGE